MPCSRSRIRAAPVRMIDSMVTWLMISITPPEQMPFGLGLNFAMCRERNRQHGPGPMALANSVFRHNALM